VPRLTLTFFACQPKDDFFINQCIVRLLVYWYTLFYWCLAIFPDTKYALTVCRFKFIFNLWNFSWIIPLNICAIPCFGFIFQGFQNYIYLLHLFFCFLYVVAFFLFHVYFSIILHWVFHNFNLYFAPSSFVFILMMVWSFFLLWLSILLFHLTFYSFYNF
jgi:hypothetical protein